MRIVILLIAVIISNAAYADEYVHGYTSSNGTYVNGYERSSPNGTVQDNYSYQGNTNPYTGSVGTNNYPHDTTSSYYNGTPNSQGQYGHLGGGKSSYGY